jgi:hypothetical protein
MSLPLLCSIKYYCKVLIIKVGIAHSTSNEKTILVPIRVIVMASKSECHSGICSILLKYAASVVKGQNFTADDYS